MYSPKTAVNETLCFFILYICVLLQSVCKNCPFPPLSFRGYLWVKSRKTSKFSLTPFNGKMVKHLTSTTGYYSICLRRNNPRSDIHKNIFLSTISRFFVLEAPYF
jgi:hypothetical protein